MADTGMKVSQSGFDAKTAADSEVLLHSSFYNLPIYQEGTFTNVVDGGTIATHDLGYEPFALVYRTVSGTSRPTLNYLITTTVIKNSGGPTMSGYYYIFKRDLTQNLSEVNINTVATTQGTQIGNMGIKISKEGFDVKTAAYKDLIIISGAKSSDFFAMTYVLDKVEYGNVPTVSPWTVTVSHSLGYAPVVKWFIKGNTSGGWFQNSQSHSSYVSSSSTDTKTRYPFDPPAQYSCFIFKDPIGA